MSEPLDEQSQVIVLVTGRLDAEGLPYMISGSVALSVYVTPRMTRDIDIVVDVPSETARLLRVFRDDFYVDGIAAERAVANRGFFNAIHLETLFKVDVVVKKETAYRRAEFSRRRGIRFAERDVYVVAPEDLMLSKLVWWRDSGSAVQWRDLEALSSTALDWKYLERWAGELGLNEPLSRLRR